MTHFGLFLDNWMPIWSLVDASRQVCDVQSLYTYIHSPARNYIKKK